MSPTRTLELDSTQQQASLNDRTLAANLLDAIRTGRIRIVDPPAGNAAFCPRMDVYDHPDSQNIIATFELPGVKITDLSISVKQGILVIRGQRPCRYRPYRQHPSLRGLSQVDAADTPTSRGQAECNTRFFPLRELRYGYFYRRFRLPQGIDISRITASLSDGLLTVCWPRSPSQKQISQSPVVGEDSCLGHPISSVRSDPHDTAKYAANGSQ